MSERMTLDHYNELLARFHELDSAIDRYGARIKPESMMNVKVNLLIEMLLGPGPTDPEDITFSERRLVFETAFLEHVIEIMTQVLADVRKKSIAASPGGGPSGLIVPGR